MMIYVKISLLLIGPKEHFMTVKLGCSFTGMVIHVIIIEPIKHYIFIIVVLAA